MELIRELRFRWRRKLPSWRRKAFDEKSLDPVLEDQELIPLEWLSGLSDLRQRLSLMYAEWLSQVPREHFKSVRSCLEIGVMDFSYVAGVAAWLQGLNPNFQLKGIEADGFVTYANGYRRRDLANFYATRLHRHLQHPSIFYEDANWLTFSEKDSWDLVLSFFPFLWSDLSKAWGLPQDHFDVVRFYEKALRQGRRVLFFHQGEEEVLESKRRLMEIGAQILYEAPSLHNRWIKRKHPVGVLVFCQKN